MMKRMMSMTSVESRPAGLDPVRPAAASSSGVMAGECGPTSIADAGDVRLRQVMNCSPDCLPPISSKIVRIFMSSTFTDTTLERNTLMQNVYPKVKDYCRERHGLEFQVVDMRWGVRDEATDDHMTTELCLNEIDNCQRLSTGPSFCVSITACSQPIDATERN